MRQETFATPRQLALNVSLPRGDLQIQTADTEETTVTLSGSGERAERQLEKAEIRFDDRGDYDELTVDLDTEDFGFRKGRLSFSISLDRHDAVDVRITVPHGTRVVANSASADIRADGRFGAMEANSASGDVLVGEVEDDATLKTASGDIRITRVGGSLKANSAAGDLRVGPGGGTAEIKTAAGDVDVDEVGGSVTVHGASGDVRVGAVTAGSAELKSVSGDMLVGIRRGSRVWMDVKTVTGDARSELDVGSDDDDGEGPLVELRATTMSGDIKIVRA